MKKLIGFAVVAAALGGASTARAGCDKDADCKGDRICVNGECTAPAQQPAVVPAPVIVSPPPPVYAPQPATYAPPASSYPAHERIRAGWARGAGITGLVFAPIVLGMMIGAAVTLPEHGHDSAIPAAPLGGTALILHIIGGALAGGGANSARGVDHMLGLSIPGWILYGITIAYVILEFAIGYGLEGPPPAVVVGVGGALSFTSIVLLSLDGIVRGSRANSRLEEMEEQQRRPLGVTLVPVLTPVRNGSQVVGLSGGLGLVF